MLSTVRNEIIIRLRPEPRISMKLLVKPLKDDPRGSKGVRRVEVPLFCAQGQSEDTTRPLEDTQCIPFTDEELSELKRILEPLNQPANVRQYTEGSQGPTEADFLCDKQGYLHNPNW